MARRKVADLQARLARDGFVHYAASDAWCEAAASDARAALDAALAPGAWLPECLRPRVGTNIRTRTRRWDVAVDASAAVAAAVAAAAAPADHRAAVVGVTAAPMHQRVAEAIPGAPAQQDFLARRGDAPRRGSPLRGARERRRFIFGAIGGRAPGRRRRRGVRAERT
ncbi:phytanoyl-CoA dioxygenase [Aureococcus anophagefferens]|nr:phytanoyl-CoA dioxygenase [Aureococcus anophagefferens]